MITGGAAMMLMGFVMFFVFSVVLSLSPAELAMAKEQNISVLSYLANEHASPIISYLGPIVAFAAITSSYFGHFLGAHEGLVGLVKSRSNMQVSKIEKISLGFIVITTWIVAIVNPSILGMIETMGAPMIAAILFLLPVFAMHKVPAMAKFKTSAPVQIFTVICGLAAISSVIYGAL
ncbi:serine transporter [Vibrio cholerae]|nr:serine transporter [Vibrio cholerae]